MNQTLNAKMRARMEEVRAQVAERDDLIEVIAIALLTRKNVFILGDTGQANIGTGPSARLRSARSMKSRTLASFGIPLQNRWKT